MLANPIFYVEFCDTANTLRDTSASSVTLSIRYVPGIYFPEDRAVLTGVCSTAIVRGMQRRWPAKQIACTNDKVLPSTMYQLSWNHAMGAAAKPE